MTSYSATYHVSGDPNDESGGEWVVTRNGRVFARRSTLGEIASLIARCDRDAPSKWTVDGISVRAGWAASRIADRLARFGRGAEG